jgi:hypothetical protein
MVNDFKLSAAWTNDFIEGYTALSRASEGASWDGIALPNQTKRVFILAGLEEPGLFKNEVQTFKNLYEKRKDLQMIVVLNAGHIIGHSQPKAFTSLLGAITQANSPFTGGVAIVEPTTGQLRYAVGDDAFRVLDTLITSGPVSLKPGLPEKKQ